MNRKLLEFTQDGRQVLVSAENDGPDIEPTLSLDDAVTKVTESLEKKFDSVVALGEAFGAALSKLNDVNTAELEIGLNFTGKGSVYVVETTGEASLKVKIQFKK